MHRIAQLILLIVIVQLVWVGGVFAQRGQVRPPPKVISPTIVQPSPNISPSISSPTLPDLKAPVIVPPPSSPAVTPQSRPGGCPEGPPCPSNDDPKPVTPD